MAAGFRINNRSEKYSRERDEDLDSLWHAYKEKGCQEARRKLIIAHLSLVHFVIGRLLLSLPSHLDEEDLFSYGVLGLIDAVEGFDPERGFRFSTYAVPRIRGAIIDELRLMEGIPPSWRRKAREIGEVMAGLERRLGRTPEDEEVASELGLSVGEFRETMDEIRHPLLVSLDDMITRDGEDLRLGDLIADEGAEDPSARVGEKEILETLGQLIENLPEREALILSLYYRDGLTLKEVAETLDLSPARISQLHSKAIFRLRGLFGQKIRSGFTVH